VIEGQFIGVDVGGTKVVAATLERGVLGESELVPTDTSSTDTVIDQLCDVVERVRSSDTRAVGIGVPSVVEFATGRIRFSVNIPLADIPLRRLLTERLGLPVYVENDANCAALAEAYDGDELTTRHLVMFTVGTGVGGGLVLDGRLYRGATGAAPEIGHQIVGLDLTDGVPESAASFPQPGSLEAYAAGTELDRLARRFAREQPHSELGRILRERGTLMGRDAVEAAQAGDAAGLTAVRLLGERLGVGIANAINVFDPEEIVVGGGASAAGELLLEPARQVARRFVLPGAGTKTTIRLARRGVEAGVVGAALIAAHALAEEQEGAPPAPAGEAARGPRPAA
jgi:glucokinase